MDYLCLIGFWITFGAGLWAGMKHARHPEYFKAKFARIFHKD
jgi:hypothetical protein